MNKHTLRAKLGTEGLNVPRSNLIELAFENDDDLIEIESTQEYQRNIWLYGKEQCHQLQEKDL